MRTLSRTRDDAVEGLVHRHQRSLRGYLLYLGCPSALVEDLVQEVFLAFLSARFEERSEPATAAYLRTIARNLFLKTMQRERRQLPLPDLDEADHAWVEYEGADEGETYLAALRACLERVRGRAAEVLRLRYRAALGRVTIAERLGLTESGVKSILVRSRKKLRECVERRLAS